MRSGVPGLFYRNTYRELRAWGAVLRIESPATRGGSVGVPHRAPAKWPLP